MYSYKDKKEAAISAVIMLVVVVGLVVLVLPYVIPKSKPLQVNTTEELIAEVGQLQRDIATLKAEQIEYEKRLDNVYRAILIGITAQAIFVGEWNNDEYRKQMQSKYRNIRDRRRLISRVRKSYTVNSFSEECEDESCQ